MTFRVTSYLKLNDFQALVFHKGVRKKLCSAIIRLALLSVVLISYMRAAS